MPEKARDQACMEMAFELALQVKGRTLPNPPVGAVLMKHGRLVGQGATRPAGQAHAEIVALEQARENARGATLYVTLEPCRHFGKTPPCTRALIAAGVSRVVAACNDPNPLMSGKGLAELRRAGIDAAAGLLQERAQEFYTGFFFFLRHGRPQITMKIAQSLNGRINQNPGVETVLTGRESRKRAHALRAAADAVLIGGGTLRRDNPRLTPRLVSGHVPEALILTRGNRLNPRWFLLRRRAAKTTLLTPRAIRGLPEWVDSCRVSTGDESELLRSLLDLFEEKGYHQVLVEGGRSVWAPLLNSGYCDRLFLFTAPKLLPRGERWEDTLRPSWAKSLVFHRFTTLGEDTLTEFQRKTPRR